MPWGLNSLMSAYADLPVGDRNAWLQKTAPLFVQSVGAFCVEPAALLGAQRGLLLLAPRRSPEDALNALQAALARVDQDLGEDGGFSRLLDAALHAGEVAVFEKYDADGVEGPLKPLAQSLEVVGQRVGLLDDLSHALSVRTDVASAVVVVRGLLDTAATLGADLTREDIDAWLLEKATDPRIPPTLDAWRRGVPSVADAVEGLFAKDLALTLIAAGERDEARLRALLDASDLDADEVIDLLDLL